MGADGICDLVIVGGGPGGLTAGIYAMRAALDTVLVERGAVGGQIAMSDSVENWPGEERIGGFDLAQKFMNHAESYRLPVRQEEVVSVEPGLECHTVRLEGGEAIRTYSVILAPGGSPRRLNIAGELEYYGKGVSYCAVCDGFFFRNKVVAVVGGGDSATEESLYLAKLARKVHLIHRRDSLRASMILQQRVKAECNIDIHWSSVIREILADKDGVRGIVLSDTRNGEERDLAVDGVFIFVGFLPNNSLVPAGIRKNADGYVITDEKCETNIPGIFVVGDLRDKYARQILAAASDGCTAALAAARYVETRKGSVICETPA